MKKEDSLYIPEFEKYVRSSEPDVRVRADIWRTAIGLQQVDQLTVSDFLKQTAQRNIEGEISIDEADRLVKTYYQSKERRVNDDEDKEEADKVAINITKVLGEQSFTFSVAGLAAIHRHIFAGVFKQAGVFRQYDITKNEWVLRGHTVLYSHWQDLSTTLEYDIEQEKKYNYSSLTISQAIEHIADFVARIWQIHPFAEGNTRTTAIFTIKYLRSIGLSDINNQLFEQHSWYFRNALVRANYRNLQSNISPDNSYLVLFFRNLLLSENNILTNRQLHIDFTERTSTEQVPNKQRTSSEQVATAFETENENIKRLIQALGQEKMSIKELMAVVGLKHRPTFMDNYLNPAIAEGFVRMLYPDSPRHPRQKYLLTIKGVGWYNEHHK